MIKPKKIIFKLVSFFSLIVIISILLLNLNTFYWADDYNFMVDLETNGILQNCIKGYFNWDGRFLSLAAFFQGFFLKYIQIEFVTLFWSLCFLGSGLFLYKIITLELNFSKAKSNHKIIFFIVTSLILWLGSYSHLFETIYWGTGGVYSLDLLLGALWIYIFLRFQKNNFSIQSKILFFLFSIIIGSTTQNLSVAVITLLLITMCIDFLDSKKTSLKYNSLLLLALIFGLLFIVLAPGNFKRMDNIENLNTSYISFWSIIKGFLTVLLSYSKRALLLVILAAIGAIAIRFQSCSRQENQEDSTQVISIKQKSKWLLTQLKWLLVALSTITPFAFMPQMASHRTTIFFLFFIQIFVYYIVLSFKSKEAIYVSSKRFQTSIVLLLLIISLSGIFAGYNLKKGLILKEVITERENILKKSENKVVIIKLINPSLKSRCFNFNDFNIQNKTGTDFIQTGQEKYYKVKKINVIE
ncbi:DUF6056 family protein [Flavobacterium sp.]|uniref:DUF6056 family protein n=1 Tax=Flavobacterium sp. TaxID=239 RepID=UPI00286DE538|nr:DUF6056 family protein [Flavobacterium sp.]